MLIGQYTSKLTNKGRISIPKKFREELGNNLVISRWYENCLVLVASDNWRKLQNRLTGENVLVTSTVRDIDRFILGSAYEINLDFQGRFVLPELLLEHSGITDEAVFVGLNDRVEIWSKTKWIELEKSVEQRANVAIEKLAKK